MSSTTTIILFLTLTAAYSQVTFSSPDMEVNITLKTTLQVTTDSYVPIVPDAFTNIEFGTRNIYALTTRNIIQIYSASDPTLSLNNFTTYSYANNITYDLTYLAINAA
jgi:hypothetical protein